MPGVVAAAGVVGEGEADAGGVREVGDGPDEGGGGVAGDGVEVGGVGDVFPGGLLGVGEV